LRCALDQGINFFDTSDLYGFGHSEELLGKTFAGCRERVVLASKGGMVGNTGQDFSPEYLRKALHDTLHRLRTDYVDVYQLHSPAVPLLREKPDTLELMKELQSAGKIRAWGISARSPEEARIAVEEFAAPVIQVNFNLTDQRANENGLFALCQQRNVGVIVRTPLCFGFLTGHYQTAGFASTDHRSRWSSEQIQKWQQANNSFRFLFEVNPKNTPAQIALRFCLSFAAVSTTIPGMLLSQHVNENAASSILGPLSPEQLQRINEVYSTTQFFVPKG
jgi:aryl-alcohol dehydrogenase-like predicted oxidoreductase